MTRTSRIDHRQAGLALAGLLLASTLGSGSAFALDAERQLLSGTITMVGDTTRFTAPGGAAILTADFPAAGLGETATQISMPGGVLSKLRVNFTPAASPSSGGLRVMVRINGTNTSLTCRVTDAGSCATKKSKTVTVQKNDQLAIRVTNDFVGAGNMALTYTMEFN